MTISRRHIVGLGVSQIICWGVSFYQIGVFGQVIGDDLNWSLPVVHGAFSVALIVMGITSPLIGRWVDAYGGRIVLSAGSVFLAIGCWWLSMVETITSYYLAWSFMGIAMRCCLYDAAFAALARIAGPAARRPISQITLLGGLSATLFWPFGQVLLDSLGWREALVVFAGLALLTLAVHLPLPSERHEKNEAFDQPDRKLDVDETPLNRNRMLSYVTIVTLGNALHAGMSAHMIGILGQLGLGAGVAVAVASVRGVGQSFGRLIEVVTGSRLHPVDLNLLAAGMLPIAFALGLASGVSVVAAFSFSFFYGIGTGLLTITRGALPLVLFEDREYGTYVGKLLVPGFIASAAAPFIFAWVIEQWGGTAALYVSLAVLMLILAASLVLKRLQHARSAHGE